MQKIRLPISVSKYFWGDDLNNLDIQKNKHYIIQTILEKGDQEAIRWLFSILGNETIKNALSTLRLDKKSAQFWKIYLS